MGAEFIANSLEDMCDLMCNNRIPGRSSLNQITDEICEKVCRWYVKALEENKDPDVAQVWLEDNYCRSCPLNKLEDVCTKKEI